MATLPRKESNKSKNTSGHQSLNQDSKEVHTVYCQKYSITPHHKSINYTSFLRENNGNKLSYTTFCKNEN